MKLPLNHKDPLDKQLHEKLHNADAMPPSFHRLFGEKGVNIPAAKWSVYKWLRSSLFIFSATSLMGLSALLHSDRSQTADFQTFNVVGTAQETLQSHSEDIKRHVATDIKRHVATDIKRHVATAANGRKEHAQTAHKQLPHNLVETNGEMINDKNRKKSFLQPLFNESKPTKANQLTQFTASIELYPETNINIAYAEPHSLNSSLEQVTLSQVEEAEKGNLPIIKMKPSILPLPSKGNWYVGFTTGLNNTWILNQNTYNEFDGYEFAYKVDWGYQYGIRAGYHPSRKGWGFEIGYVPKSAKGQQYEDVIQEVTQHREVDLNYEQAIFKLKYRQPLSRKDNGIALNWELGGGYNRLNSAYQSNNGELSNITERFRKHSWQAVAGASADIPITKSVFFSLGVQGSVSTDINAEGWRAPDSYGKSHTIVLGVQTGISYQFN